jgi:hypothetical protein
MGLIVRLLIACRLNESESQTAVAANRAISITDCTYILVK